MNAFRPSAFFALSTAAAVGLLAVVHTGAARGQQAVTFRLGYGGAAEEPMWLLIAKPDLTSGSGKSYRLDPIKFVSSDKRARACTSWKVWRWRSPTSIV